VSYKNYRRQHVIEGRKEGREGREDEEEEVSSYWIALR
jgi:hypothetical protein